MEADADFSRRQDLGVDQIGAAAREQIVVVAGSGATREKQFRHAGERRHVHALFVQPGPDRVEGAQPVEELGVGRGCVGTGERLVEVVVRVDQAGEGDEVPAVDDAVGLGQARGAGAHAADFAVFYVEMASAMDLVSRVHGKQRVDVSNEQ